MKPLDGINLEILKRLQEDGRTSITELARAVGRAESTVRERLASLESEGIVQGYQARIDWGRAGLPAVAVLRARCGVGNIDAVAKELGRIPNVTRAVMITGPAPVLAFLRVRDMQHLQNLLRGCVGEGHLTHIETELQLDTLVENRAPNLGEQGEGVGDAPEARNAALPLAR
jgi:Lrp/AsnC family leucine-responsive transcriptional regulator